MDLTPGFGDADIEQAAVSCLMQWQEESFALIDSHNITTEHFQTPQNRILFNCLSHYWRTGKPIHIVPFTAELRELGLLDSVGGAYYVTQTWLISCYSPTVFEYYLDMIEESHGKILLMKTCTSSAEEAQAPAVEGELLVNETIEELAAIPMPSRHKVKDRSLGDALKEKREQIVKGEVASDILLTGLEKLDALSPLHHGDMPLIAGMRKAGKSILALSIGLNVARRGIPVVYFSLEDRESKMIDRVAANLSKRSMNAEGFTSMEIESLDFAALHSPPFQIIDDVFELGRIVSVARELKARKDIGLIIVDYGQLVVVPERRDTNREQRVAEMSRTLRLLAMELNTPLILLSQLNDAGMTRESRSLEQDATAMWCMRTVQKKGCPDEIEPAMRKIAIPWQRNGESGVGCYVAFLGAQARVENLADHISIPEDEEDL